MLDNKELMQELIYGLYGNLGEKLINEYGEDFFLRMQLHDENLLPKLAQIKEKYEKYDFALILNTVNGFRLNDDDVGNDDCSLYPYIDMLARKPALSTSLLVKMQKLSVYDEDVFYLAMREFNMMVGAQSFMKERINELFGKIPEADKHDEESMQFWKEKMQPFFIASKDILTLPKTKESFTKYNQWFAIYELFSPEYIDFIIKDCDVEETAAAKKFISEEVMDLFLQVRNFSYAEKQFELDKYAISHALKMMNEYKESVAGDIVSEAGDEYITKLENLAALLKSTDAERWLVARQGVDLDSFIRSSSKAYLDLSLFKNIFPNMSDEDKESIKRLWGSTYGITLGCPNQCSFCAVDSPCKMTHMPYPIALKMGEFFGDKGYYYKSDALWYEDKIIGADGGDFALYLFNYLNISNSLTTKGVGVNAAGNVVKKTAVALEKICKTPTNLSISLPLIEEEDMDKNIERAIKTTNVINHARVEDVGGIIEEHRPKSRLILMDDYKPELPAPLKMIETNFYKPKCVRQVKGAVRNNGDRLRYCDEKMLFSVAELDEGTLFEAGRLKSEKDSLDEMLRWMRQMGSFFLTANPDGKVVANIFKRDGKGDITEIPTSLSIFDNLQEKLNEKVFDEDERAYAYSR